MRIPATLPLTVQPLIGFDPCFPDKGSLASCPTEPHTLPSATGAWSSQRHWHSAEDKFVWVLEGEVVLVTEGREEILRAGDCAGFKAGEPNGHQLQNRSDQSALVREVGSRRPHEDVTEYSDIDLRYSEAGGDMHKDGTPY